MSASTRRSSPHSARSALQRADRSRKALVVAGLLLLVALTGCIPSTYSYPLDFFNEMHYQQSFRRQEPPVQSAPEGAVPRTGGEPALTQAQLAQATNPVPASPENLAEAARLYQRNCAMCHGAQGMGDGIIAAYFRDPRYNGPVPKSYDDPTVQARTDGELFAIITNGVRNEETLVGMPAFRKLLTERERWLLVRQIRAFQGRQQ